MALTKREEKEIQILNSAEKAFSEYGYDNTKMENIAEWIGISKGLVYFYYNSKENLYMALTYRAIHKMNDMFYGVYHSNQEKNGLDATITLVQAYIDFLDENPFYLELLLNYTRLVRSSNQKNNQLTDSMKTSIYFRKIKDIHNIPITIFQEEINRIFALLPSDASSASNFRKSCAFPIKYLSAASFTSFIASASPSA